MANYKWINGTSNRASSLLHNKALKSIGRDAGILGAVGQRGHQKWEWIALNPRTGETTGAGISASEDEARAHVEIAADADRHPQECSICRRKQLWEKTFRMDQALSPLFGLTTLCK